MQLNLNKQSVTIDETALDSSYEQGMECDLMLPDYCPDVVKILKCCVTPAILSAQATGDKISIDGIAIISLYYQSDTSAVCSYEHRYNFTKTCDLKTALYRPMVRVSVSMDYVNCRAISQRRVDVRGAMTLHVTAQGQRTEEVVTGAQGMGIWLKKNTHSVSSLAAWTEKPFTVREELELESGKTAVQILRAKCSILPGEYKAIPNKIILKGDLLVHILYRPEGEEALLETAEYTLPVSQILDVEGLDEDSLCDVRLSILSSDCSLRAEGAEPGFALAATIGTQIGGYRREDLSLAEDCYSTKYESDFGAKTLELCRIEDLVNETWPYKTTVDLPEEMDSISDIWCDTGKNTLQCEEGEAVLRSKLTLCLLGCDPENRPVFREMPLEIVFRKPISSEDASVEDPEIQILSTSCSMAGSGKLEVTCSLRISFRVSRKTLCQAISSLNVDEGKPQTRENNNALTIYFADPGESVWEIAKRYHTSVEAVAEENDITGEFLTDKQMLMIPII